MVEAVANPGEEGVQFEERVFLPDLVELWIPI